jgi:hypothetical protein
VRAVENLPVAQQPRPPSETLPAQTPPRGNAIWLNARPVKTCVGRRRPQPAGLRNARLRHGKTAASAMKARRENPFFGFMLEVSLTCYPGALGRIAGPIESLPVIGELIRR